MSGQRKGDNREGTCQAKLFYKYDQSSSTPSSDSLELLFSAKTKSFVREFHSAQALFPEFFEKSAMKYFHSETCQTSHASVMNSVRRPGKRQLDEAIEIWYMNEYGLVTSS